MLLNRYILTILAFVVANESSYCMDTSENILAKVVTIYLNEDDKLKLTASFLSSNINVCVTSPNIKGGKAEFDKLITKWEDFDSVMSSASALCSNDGDRELDISMFIRYILPKVKDQIKKELGFVTA